MSANSLSIRLTLTTCLTPRNHSAFSNTAQPLYSVSFCDSSVFSYLRRGTASAQVVCIAALQPDGISQRRLSRLILSITKGYNMAYQQQDKTPANWVITKVLDNNVTLKVSDKGAIMLRSTHDDKFIACFLGSQAEQIVNASGDMANMLVSEEYKALIEAKAKNKEKAYLEKQVATHILKAQKMAQAAIDALVATGLSKEQAQAILTPKAG